MAYFQTKRDYIKAWRNDGISTPPEWTAEFGVKMTTDNYTNAIEIGKVIVFTGDWFVVDKNEDCFSMNNDDFNENYEAVK